MSGFFKVRSNPMSWKKLLIFTILAIGITLTLAKVSFGEDSTVANYAKVTVATAFGMSFPTSPSGTDLNSGFNKTLLFIYHTSDHFAIGGIYSAIGFTPTSLTESNIQSYGLFGLYYGRVYKRLGAFTKFALIVQSLNGSPDNFGQINGFGAYYVLNDRFCPFLGFDIAPVEQSTKTYTATIYIGLETAWK